MSLTGCGGFTHRITTDGVNYTQVQASELNAPCHSTARVCIIAEGSLAEPRASGFGASFSHSSLRSLSPAACDIGVKFPNTWTDFMEVVDTKGRFVARIEEAAVSNGVSSLCHALSPGGLLAGKVTLQSATEAVVDADETPEPPARAQAVAAPSNAVSREELAQMIAQINRNNQPASSAEPASRAETLVPRFSGPERADDLAVIVGIESYSEITSKAQYAERDADAFKSYVRALGVPERNIVLLKGSKAGKASLEKNVGAWLTRLAKADSRVYFYFSGHGAPDVKTGRAYLVPWDGDPNFLEDTAYPVAKLYKTLGALPAKQVLVAMDSCFSGAGGRSVLASGARPLVGKIETGAVPAKITVLAASGANEISGSLDDKGHGAFTYFLLQGLDAGKTTPKQLSEYLTPRVQDEAKRLNRDQTPQLQGDGSWSLR